MRYVAVLFVLLLAIVAPGCARQVRVGVTTYLSPQVPFPPPSTATTIAVVVESNTGQPLLNQEVQRKIEYLVRQHGYGIGALDDTDYILSAYFALGPGVTEVGSIPVYHPGGIGETGFYAGRGRWTTGTIWYPGYTTYEPYSFTVYRRYLDVNLYEQERWRRSQGKNLSGAVAWSAAAISPGRSSDLRGIIAYLLVATFADFGKDTGREVWTTLSSDNKRIKALHASLQERWATSQPADQGEELPAPRH